MQPRDQRQSGRFAGAGRSDQRDHGARIGREAQARETDATVRVDEPHIVEHDVTAARRQHRRVRRVDNARPFVDHSEDTRQPGQPLLERRVQRAQRTQRPRGDQQRGDEAGEVADRLRAGRGTPAGKADYRGDRRAAQHLQHRIDARAAFGHAHQCAVELGEDALRPLGLGRLQTIRAHRAGLGEALVQHRRGLAHPLLHAARRAADAPADILDRHRRQRIHRRGDQAEQPVEIQHRGDQPDHRDRIGNAVHRAGQRVADDGGIGGEAGGELRRRLPLQPCQVGAREMGEHAALQLADHQQHDLLHLHVLEVLRRRLDRGDGNHQRGNLVQDAPVAVGEHLECVVDHHRIQRGGAGHQAGQHQHQRQARFVMADMLAPQPAKQRARRVAPGCEVTAGCDGIHGQRVISRGVELPARRPAAQWAFARKRQATRRSTKDPRGFSRITWLGTLAPPRHAGRKPAPSEGRGPGIHVLQCPVLPTTWMPGPRPSLGAGFRPA